MTWSYSGDPATSQKDEVRFLIGDTDTKEQLLQDEEIQYLLTTTGLVIVAAIKCCDAIIAKFSKDFDYSLSSESNRVTQRLTAYRFLRKTLRTQMGGVPSGKVSTEALFSKNMMSNK